MVIYTMSGESEGFKKDNQKEKTSYLPSISSTFSCISSLYSNCGDIMQVGSGEPGSVHSHANTNQPTPTHGLKAWPLLEVIEWPRRAKCLWKERENRTKMARNARAGESGEKSLPEIAGEYPDSTAPHARLLKPGASLIP